VGISFEAIILILVLALVLFGPEKLPELAEKIGKWVAKLRQASSDLSQHYHQAVNPLLTPPPPPPHTPSRETLCPQCSQKIGDNFHFCPHCGCYRDDFEPPDTPNPGAVTSSVTYCPQCARKLEEDFLFCPLCGYSQGEEEHYPEPEPPQPPKQVTCPHCARQLDTDFLFCPGCGQPPGKSAAPPKSPAP